MTTSDDARNLESDLSNPSPALDIATAAAREACWTQDDLAQLAFLDRVAAAVIQAIEEHYTLVPKEDHAGVADERARLAALTAPECPVCRIIDGHEVGCQFDSEWVIEVEPSNNNNPTN